MNIGSSRMARTKLITCTAVNLSLLALTFLLIYIFKDGLKAAIVLPSAKWGTVGAISIAMVWIRYSMLAGLVAFNESKSLGTASMLSASGLIGILAGLSFAFNLGGFIHIAIYLMFLSMQPAARKHAAAMKNMQQSM